HLVWWMREVADSRVHGTTGEAPIVRFRAKEAAALRPLEGRTTFQPVRECVRRVHSDACVELETNRYSVPWRLIGETVTVLVNEQVRVLHAGQGVAVHTRLAGQRRASIQREHLLGLSAPSRDRRRAQSTYSPRFGRSCCAHCRSTNRSPEVPGEARDLRSPCADGHVDALEADRDSRSTRQLLDTATRRKLTLLDPVKLLCE